MKNVQPDNSTSYPAPAEVASGGLSFGTFFRNCTPSQPTSGSDGIPNRRRSNLHLLILPVALAIALFVSYPFSDVLTTRTFSISMLTPIQKSNIELAAQAINGLVLQPGEEFSFNRVVGPRAEARGYRAAPSYLGPESLSTLGGGVCLMSSAVYQLALESGCQIDQRVPHLRTIQTVPAGLDATVWYGKADLCFKNTLPCPVQLVAATTSESLRVTLLGRKPAGFAPAKLERVVTCSAPGVLVVELLRRQDKQEVTVSRDHYAIAN